VPAKYLTVEGIATFLHHRGPTTLPGSPPDLSHGSPVLCVHDAGATGNSFAGVLDALAGSQSPLAFDLPGHGRSGSLDSLGAIDRMADHTRAVAHAIGLRHPVVVGDGMGAAVALELAAGPDPLAAAVVLCGGAAASFPAAAAQAAELRLVTAGRARREFDRSGYAPDTPREVFERAFADWVRTDPRATVGDRDAQAAWDASGRLAGVDVPVLVLVGAHEEATSVDAARAVADGVANGRLVTVADVGRRMIAERPDAVAAEIDRFLEEVRR
jgi:3-oxoadipate enol-lactonase